MLRILSALFKKSSRPATDIRAASMPDDPTTPGLVPGNYVWDTKNAPRGFALLKKRMGDGTIETIQVGSVPVRFAYFNQPPYTSRP